MELAVGSNMKPQKPFMKILVIFEKENVHFCLVWKHSFPGKSAAARVDCRNMGENHRVGGYCYGQSYSEGGHFSPGYAFQSGWALLAVDYCGPEEKPYFQESSLSTVLI